MTLLLLVIEVLCYKGRNESTIFLLDTNEAIFGFWMLLIHYYI